MNSRPILDLKGKKRPKNTNYTKNDHDNFGMKRTSSLSNLSKQLNHLVRENLRLLKRENPQHIICIKRRN